MYCNVFPQCPLGGTVCQLLSDGQNLPALTLSDIMSLFLFHQGALSATYSALRRCAPAPVLEPVQSSGLAQRRGMKKLESPKVNSDPKEKE